MALNDWKPKTQSGRLVKKRSVKDTHELFRSVVPIKELEIVDWITGAKTVENASKEIPLGSGEYRTTAYVVAMASGFMVLGKRCAKNTKAATEAAARNAK